MSALAVISVHVPKCAGRALRRALERAYGSVCEDYADRPFDPSSAMHLDPDGFFARSPAPPGGARAIHGHFHAAKYRHVPAAVPRIAILRHPVARTISHYRYWQRTEPGGHTLHRYMRDENLDLLAFARLPFIRHAYRQVMFAGLDRAAFAFVGTMETLDADLPRLNRLLGVELALSLAADDMAQDETPPPPETLAALHRLLADDTAFHESWVASG